MYFMLMLVFAVVFRTAMSYSSFTCGEPWPVWNDDNLEMSLKIQKLFFAWQNVCDGRAVFNQPALSSGLGSSLVGATSNFVLAMECGKVYRPHSFAFKDINPFLWADTEATACTHHRRSFDCFLEPVSSICYTELSDEEKEKVPISQRIQANETQLRADLNALFGFRGLDVCAMGKITGKPMQWVFGQILVYFLRYRPDIQEQVRLRNRAAFANVNASFMDGATIGVHVRGGRSMAHMKTFGGFDGRKPMEMKDYMRHVDHIAEMARISGRRIAIVYLCGDVPEETFISVEHMQQQFPRDFTYAIASHASLGPGEPEENLGKHRNHGQKINMEQQNVEYFSDMEILSSVDYYLGSLSSIYLVVEGLRIARGLHAPGSTCLLDLRLNDPPLECGVGPMVKEVWKERGFEGGTQLE